MWSDYFQLQEGTKKTCNVRDIPALSYNHYCNGKAINITHYECVFVTLGIQHAMRMRHAVISALSDSTIFLHILS
jgi:hypothetical protein